MLTSPTTTTHVDRARFSIVFHRTLAAAPEQVFDAWTRPEHVTCWWDPSGTRLAECTIDLRPGGAFSFVNEGHSPPFSGVYRSVERPTKLVFDALGALGTVVLERVGAETHMTVTIQCASADHFEQFLKLGVDANTGRTLDNLVAHVGNS